MAVCINAEGGDQHEVIADVQPVDQDFPSFRGVM
jgi:hypothetical protein